MIENDQYRMVSFSKRRKGLFKKAEELSKLTGARTAVLVVSQAGRPHSSVSPPSLSLDSLVEGFLSSDAAGAAASPIDGDCSESLAGFFEFLNGDFSESDDPLSASFGDSVDAASSIPSSVSLDSYVDGFLSAEVAGDGQDRAVPEAGASSIGDLLGGAVDEYLSESHAVPGAGEAAASIGELLASEIDCSESVEELLALKEKLEGLREEVRSALDSQFVNSLFA